MPYFLKLVKGQTYDLQGIQFRQLGQEKRVPKHIYDYAKNGEQFEGRFEDEKPTTNINEMDLDALKAYAEANQIDLGKSTSEDGVRNKIKEALKAE